MIGLTYVEFVRLKNSLVGPDDRARLFQHVQSRVYERYGLTIKPGDWNRMSFNCATGTRVVKLCNSGARQVLTHVYREIEMTLVYDPLLMSVMTTLTPDQAYRPLKGKGGRVARRGREDRERGDWR